VKRCLRFFKAIGEKGGSAGRWDLIKVAGNEAAFKRWVEDFLVYHGFVEEVVEGGRTVYRQTERGKDFQRLLEDHDYLMAFRRIMGRKLRGILNV